MWNLEGGMIAGIAMALDDERKYWLFDSFEGQPLAKEIDGAQSLEWQADKNSSCYYEKCSASEEEAFRTMQLSGASKGSIVQGWFNETLPSAWIASSIINLAIMN